MLFFMLSLTRSISFKLCFNYLVDFHLKLDQFEPGSHKLGWDFWLEFTKQPKVSRTEIQQSRLFILSELHNIKFYGIQSWIQICLKNIVKVFWYKSNNVIVISLSQQLFKEIHNILTFLLRWIINFSSVISS